MTWIQKQKFCLEPFSFGIVCVTQQQTLETVTFELSHGLNLGLARKGIGKASRNLGGQKMVPRQGRALTFLSTCTLCSETVQRSYLLTVTGGDRDTPKFDSSWIQKITGLQGELSGQVPA